MNTFCVFCHGYVSECGKKVGIRVSVTRITDTTILPRLSTNKNGDETVSWCNNQARLKLLYPTANNYKR